MQYDFVRVGTPLEVPESRSTIPIRRQLIALCRERDVPSCTRSSWPDPDARLIWEWSPMRAPPVCCCWNGHRRHHGDVAEELDCSDIIGEIYPLPGDPVVEKFGYGAFHNTNLLRWGAR
jgi:nicotinamidase-related amidase